MIFILGQIASIALNYFKKHHKIIYIMSALLMSGLVVSIMYIIFR